MMSSVCRIRGAAKSAGFTLIELLVVIAIISMLMGMLAPVFSRAKSQARQINCIANCKQLATATMMYLDANDNRLPAGYQNGTYWFERLLSYTKNPLVYHCPDAKSEPGTVSFSINANLEGQPAVMIGDESSRIWLADGFEEDNAVAIGNRFHLNVAYDFDKLPDPAKRETGQVGYRHNGGAIFTFMDWHCKWMPKEKLASPDGDKYWKGEAEATP